jgi:hypothetical protein
MTWTNVVIINRDYEDGQASTQGKSHINRMKKPPEGTDIKTFAKKHDSTNYALKVGVSSGNT